MPTLGSVFCVFVVLWVFVCAVWDSAFEDSHGFSFAFASFEAAFVVGSAFGVRVWDLAEGCCVDDPAGLAVPAPVQTVAFDSSAAGLDGCCPVGRRVTRFRGEPCRIAGFSEDLSGGE